MKKKIKTEAKKTSKKFHQYSINLMPGSGLSTRKIAIMEARARLKGPTIWLTGCIHGDEVGSMVVIHEIFRKLRKQSMLKGKIYAMPLMNPTGFEHQTRYLSLSREDLNRSFPGNESGSLAEQTAFKITQTILETKPDLVIDIHNDWTKSIPYTVIDPNPKKRKKDTYEKVKEYSLQTGLLVIEDDTTEEYYSWKDTLSGSLLLQGIPTLTLELGESYIINEENVAVGVRAIRNILMHLGMVKNEEKYNYPLPVQFKDTILKYYQKPKLSTSGLIRFMVNPGDIALKGQIIARIYDTFGKIINTVHANKEGIVLGYADSSVALPGVTVIAFGIM